MCTNKIRNKFRNFTWKRALVSLVIGAAIILGGGIPLGIFYGVIAFLSYSAIVVALFATYVSIGSLELTRNMIRPFLYMAGSINAKKVGEFITLIFNIKNSGSLPGEDVHVDVDFFDKDEEVTEDNLSKKYQPPTKEPIFPLVFPNSSYYPEYILNLQNEGSSELWQNIQQGKTKCRVRIMYKSLGRKHVTIQTEKLVQRGWEEMLVTIPIPPQKWE